MRFKPIKTLRCLPIALLVFAMLLPAHAGAQNFGGFSVQAIIPDNQRDTTKTYFDLLLSPGEKQTLQVVIRNGSENDIAATLRVHTATTGRNGVILYNDQPNHDDTLPVSVADITTIRSPEVTIPANGELTVPVDLQMPDTVFDGCILGGIAVTADMVGQEANPIEMENVQINNNYAYTIGLVISQNETPVAPDLELGAINANLVNHQPVVSANLRNIQPTIIKGMQLSAQVYRKDQTTALHTLDKDNVDMAPNSSFDLGIDWNDQAIEPGDYRLALTATHEENVWTWDELFSIPAEAAASVNSASPYIESVAMKNKMAPWIWIAVIAILVIGAVAYWFGRRTRRT